MSTYVDIVFVQDWESEREEQAREGNALPEWGDWEAIAEYLTQWDFGDESDAAHTVTADTPPWGNWDDTLELVIHGLNYVVSWNSGLRYVGLIRRPLADATRTLYWETES